MTRLKTIPVAVAGLLLSAGAVLGFTTMPDAATKGLTNATEKSGQTVPARPATVGAPAPAAPDADTAAEDETTDDVALDDAPPAGTHGAAVSAVAKADDTTPDTNHGADVSAVAKANHGQATAVAHRPAHAGKPADAGKPAKPEKPENPGKPSRP